MKVVSTTELRNDLSEFLEKVKSTKTPLVISKFGKLIAIISPFDQAKSVVDYNQYYGFLKSKETGVDFENRVRRSKDEKDYVQKLRGENG